MHSFNLDSLPKEEEGVTKFNLMFHKAGAWSLEKTAEMIAWRQILCQLKLTGQDPNRYQGLAYGNISQRTGPLSFIISGTQTGAKELLKPEDFCLVFDFDLKKNQICATVPVKPSSEALTHGAIYEANHQIGGVVHVHSPIIWRNAVRLGISHTSSGIAYGTTEMGEAVKQSAAMCKSGLIAMGGHEDGVVGFGENICQAAINLLQVLAKAEKLAIHCRFLQ